MKNRVWSVLEWDDSCSKWDLIRWHVKWEIFWYFKTRKEAEIAAKQCKGLTVIIPVEVPPMPKEKRA